MILCHTCVQKTTLLVVLYLAGVFSAFAEDTQKVTLSHAEPYGIVVTEQGERLRLAGVHMPSGLCRAESPCLTAIDSAARRHSWRVLAATDEPDRYGRPIVWLVNVQGETLQAILLEQGWAWRYAEAEERHAPNGLVAAEKKAEKAQRGLWSQSDYAVLPDTNADAGIGTFRVVEGKVHSVEKRYDRYYINFAEDWRTDFTLIVDKQHWKRFPEPWLQSLPDKMVRVRGWLFYMGGAAMAISHPSFLQLAGE
jgi:hypothetical protein